MITNSFVFHLILLSSRISISFSVSISQSRRNNVDHLAPCLLHTNLMIFDELTDVWQLDAYHWIRRPMSLGCIWIRMYEWMSSGGTSIFSRFSLVIPTDTPNRLVIGILIRWHCEEGCMASFSDFHFVKILRNLMPIKRVLDIMRAEM